MPDFPNTPMNETALWMPYEQGLSPAARTTSDAPITADPERAAPRLLTEKWVRLSRRSLVPPRSIGIIDHTGAAADLAAALTVAAGDVGATARTLSADQFRTAPGDLDTCIILLPQPVRHDAAGAVNSLATFFAERRWWPGAVAGVTDYWLVTAGGETVVTDDPPPDLVLSLIHI